VISEISRLGRNPYQIQQVIEELSESGISILMQLSRMEREFLIQRVKSGLNHAKFSKRKDSRKT
jgi:DNA invertase Pin-like site-specific DNA recombinase